MAKLNLLLPIIISFFLSLQAQAGLRLFEWTPSTTIAPLIIPVRNGETPEKAAERYLMNLERNADLMELFQGARPHLPEQKFKEITYKDNENRALLLANAPKDYTKKSDRVTNFKNILAESGQHSFILPIAANLGLSIGETRELFQQISDKFPLMIALGGDDVDPAQYKKPNFHSRNIIPARDQFEIQLIKAYTAAGKGFLFGVCRGAQISSVALGYQLITDLPFHIGEKVSHADDWHDIEVQKTKNGLLGDLTKTGRLYVNSLHHQSIIYKEGGPLQIAARSSDGVTEALEFLNGKGLLLQFHPELMRNLLGTQIISRVIQQKEQVLGRRCSRILL
ncbi:putative glutamine amidotransferase [compost metagenome]